MMVVVLLVLGAACYYIGRRLQAYLRAWGLRFKGRSYWWPFGLFYAFMIFCFAAPAALPGVSLLRTAGALWLGVLLYTLLVGAFLELLRLCRVRFKTRRAVRTVGTAAIVLVACVVTYGALHYRDIQTKHYNVTIHKADTVPSLQLVLATDLHLGYINDTDNLEDMVASIAAQSPDLVLLGGDLFDGSYAALADPDRAASLLASVKPKYGVYAVLGNHDAGPSYYDMVDFCRRAGITLLRDELAVVSDPSTQQPVLQLIGRRDRRPIGMTGSEADRAPLADLDNGVDPALPLIVLDHQPHAVDEAAAIGADLMLSGHTHQGQMFPMNLITKLSYKMDYGYGSFDGTQQIVSSGIAGWGPPLRIGTDSEVVVIDLTFEQQTIE